MAGEWTTKWRYEVQLTKYPGVYRMRRGGHLITARVLDPRTRKRTWKVRPLPDSSLDEARAMRERTLSALRDAVGGTARQRQRWSGFAALLLERKVRAGDIKSAKGREKWRYVLTEHLIPAFGEFWCDELRYADVEHWRASVAELVERGDVAPTSANTWIGVFKVVCKQMAAELELRDPAAALKPFNLATRPTYTAERPNAVPPEKVVRFVALAKKLYPTRYPMIVLGFATGLRPSSMRPLRRRGAEPDVLWNEGVLLVRRSNSLGQEVMNTTKTAKHQRIHLAPAVVAVLRAHVERIEAKPGSSRARSDLLFPSARGGLCSRSLLDVVFRDIGAALKLGFAVTPRSMRRTFKDIARAAGVSDFVRKAVSGHTTGAMDEHYSTAQQSELQGGAAAVAAFVTTRQDPTRKRSKKKAVMRAVKK